MKRVLSSYPVFHQRLKTHWSCRNWIKSKTFHHSYCVSESRIPHTYYEPVAPNLQVNQAQDLNQPNTRHSEPDAFLETTPKDDKNVDDNEDRAFFESLEANKENVEEEPDIMDEYGFYGRMLNEIRRVQGLNEVPLTNSKQKYSELKSHYFLYKNYYDMRTLGSRFKIVLAQLEDLSITQSRVPLQSVCELRKESSDSGLQPIDQDDFQTINPSNLSRKYTSHRLPMLPRIWNSPKVLEQYLKELTSKKYPATNSKRSNLIKTLILDLFRPNSPDTAYCRSTKAYNIAIRYFVVSDDLKMARVLFDQMKSEKGGVYPNAETFNLLLSPTSLRLVGGKEGYHNKYYNYYLRKAQNDLQDMQLSDQQQKNTGDDTNDTINKFTPGSKDTVYFQNPLDFAISMFKEMVNLGVSANSETWNTILTSAIGPAAKSAVLESMSRLGVPLNTMGQTAVLTDIADFFGPHKALEMICAQGSSYPISPAAINVLVSRMLDIPTSTNILVAWNIIRKYSIRQHVRFVNRKKVIVTSDTQSQSLSSSNLRVVPAVSMLNTFIAPLVTLGRLDWIVGIIGSFIYDYNVVPNITTWMSVLQTVVLLPPHPQKIPLLEYIHYAMLKTQKIEDTRQLPASVRSMIRRAEQQNKFHQEKLSQMLNTNSSDNSSTNTETSTNVNTAESSNTFESKEKEDCTLNKNTSWDPAMTNIFIETNMRDPFRKKTKHDIWSAREFWVHACKKLKWTDNPKLFVLEDFSEHDLELEMEKIRQMMKRGAPIDKRSTTIGDHSVTSNNNNANRTSWQEAAVKYEAQFQKVSTQASSFLAQFEEIGIYQQQQQRLDQDNQAATIENNPELFAVCKMLGVPEPSMMPTQPKRRKSSVGLSSESSEFMTSTKQLNQKFLYTIDTFPSLHNEWVEFYAAAKLRFRKNMELRERARRLEMQKDAYGMYINDLKIEFGLEKDEDEN